MVHGSLFSGIGGFDLAAEWMGWENAFHCEINPFGQKVLKYYWPNAICYDDITKTDFTIWRGRIDVLTGGFPCQPFSLAGKRKGTEYERHLWPQMRRAIREIKPKWIVGENVLGIVSWDGGMVFNQVQVDLEAEGYEVQPYVLPACAVNAPHRRDRVWFVAHTVSGGQQRSGEFCKSINSKKNGHWEADWDNCLFQGKSVSHLYRHDDGLSPELAGITVLKHRNESIKAYGNAVVPQVVYQIFKAIEQYEEHQN